MKKRICCDEIVFQHFIDLPRCECVFCSAKEMKSGRTRLFLVFNDQQRIYIRNAINDTWDELKDELEYDHVHTRFNLAVTERKIPCFTATAAF